MCETAESSVPVREGDDEATQPERSLIERE